MATERPFGVMVLSILEVISALFELGVGALMLLAAGLIGSFGSEIPELPSQGFTGFLAGIMAAIGAVFIVIGLISLLLAYGIWTGKGWAWMIAMIFAVISIILGILSLPAGVIGLLINLLIIYYLTRSHVKAFFGKGPPPEAPPPPPP